MPSPARRIAITTMSSPRRAPCVPSSGVCDVDLLEPQVPQRLEADQHRGLAQAAAELARGRVLVAQHAQMAGDERVVDDGHSSTRAHAIASEPVSGPRRNVELKAVDPDPARTLERALAAGASDEGVIVQRDTYFRVGSGRLKLREEEPGETHLISYSRPDDAAVRVSSLPGRARGRGHARRARPTCSASTSWSRSGGTCCCGRRCGSISTR